jgi:hypothetical protein
VVSPKEQTKSKTRKIRMIEVETLTPIVAPPPNDYDPKLFNFYEHLIRQREYSIKNFGPGMRTKGLIDHISKELVEVSQVPNDVFEWIDIIILGLDGALRTGAKPEEIIATLVAKQTKNEGRTWPDWRTAPPDQAICHVKTETENEPLPN